MLAGGGAVQLQLGIDSGVLAGRISVIADALPQIISVPLFGLRSDSCSGRPADDCAGSRTARSARQNAAEKPPTTAPPPLRRRPPLGPAAAAWPHREARKNDRCLQRRYAVVGDRSNR